MDGRVYPAQAVSPSTNMLPPHGSPSPGHSRPPQQQSPLNVAIPQHQPQQQQPSQQPSPTMFQQPRMLPPYTPPQSQQFTQNLPNIGEYQIILDSIIKNTLT